MPIDIPLAEQLAGYLLTAAPHDGTTLQKSRLSGISPVQISITNLAQKTDGFAYLYLSDDPELGRFEITVKAASTPLALTGASALELLIPTDLLSAKDLATVRLTEESATSWQMEQIEGGLRLALRTGVTLSVTTATPVKVGLLHMLAKGDREIQRDLLFSWSSFEGVEDDYRLFRLLSILPRKIFAALECKWLQRKEYVEDGGAFVYYTPYKPTTQQPGIRNRLVLSIENKGDALSGENAEFVVTFPTEEYGDAWSALCSTDQLKVVECKRYGSGKAWRITPDTEGTTKFWRLRPPVGKEVLAANEIVIFEFANLVTELAIGEARAQVHWSSLDKVSSGYASSFILKREPMPRLLDVYVLDANDVRLREERSLFAGEKYKLCWESFAADRCKVEGSPGGTFIGQTFFTFTADALEKSFRVTPQIRIGENLNEPRQVTTVTKTVCDPLANMKQMAVKEDGFDAVKVAWDSRGGTASLGGHNTPRSDCSPSGTKIFRRSDVYTLQVSALGKKTEASLGVTVPHCSLTASVKWIAPDHVEIGWAGENARVCRFWTDPPLTTPPMTSVPLTSSKKLSASSFGIAGLELSGGNGTCLWIWRNAAPATRGTVPVTNVQEIVTPETRQFRVRWNVKGGIFVGKSVEWEKSKDKMVDRPSTDFSREPPSLYHAYIMMTGNPDSQKDWITIYAVFPNGYPPNLAGQTPLAISRHLQYVAATRGETLEGFL